MNMAARTELSALFSSCPLQELEELVADQMECFQQIVKGAQITV